MSGQWLSPVGRRLRERFATVVGRYRVFRLVLAALACALLAGCYDTRQEITLNPDGSGKVVMESTYVRVEPLFNGRPVAGLENITNAVLEKLIEKSEGVDAWRDIDIRELDDGRVFARATAYFADLSKFKTELNSFQRFRVTTDPAGRLTLQPHADTSQSPVQPASTNEPVTLQSIRHERRQFRAAQPWFTATLGTLKQDTVFHVSGDVRQATNFETNGPRSLRLRMDAARLLAMLEAVIFDAEFARHRLAGSAETFFDTHFANEKLYGQKAPVLAVIASGPPRFDYASEVAEARRTYPALVRTLGLKQDLMQPRQRVLDGATAKATVTGIQWRFGGRDSGSFNPERHGDYKISVNAALPGPVLDTRRIEFTRAVTLEGARLESSSTSIHQVGWGRDPARGRTNVNFDIELKSPPLNSKGLAEVSGILECDSAENQRTVELFSGKLRPGAKGAEFGVEIEFIGSQIDRGEKLVLRTSLAPEQLLSLRVVSDAGQTVELEKRGLMSVGANRTYTFKTSRAIPRSGRLVADLLVGSQTLRIPFSITNLSLLGQPLAQVDGK